MRRLLLLNAITLLLICLCPQPDTTQAVQSNRSQYAAQLRIFHEFVKRQMAIDRIPGLSVGFVKDDFSWSEGFGYADLENKTPAKAESAYRLASITKSMTAVGLLRLYEQGKINLDAELQSYVPYFPKKKYPTTIRQLLGHLGGIRHNNLIESRNREQMTTEKAVMQYAESELIAEPGTKYSYTTPGFNLLGAAIEGASGHVYGDYMREHIWRPLGMNDTRMDSARDLIPNRVRGYAMVNGEIKLSEAVDVSNKFAGGGTRSTVPDLLRFARGVMSSKLLTPQTTELMFTPQANRSGRYSDTGDGHYSMGWSIAPVSGHFTAQHSGGQQETSTFLWIFPAKKFAVAVAANLEGADTSIYLRRLTELILEEPWGVFVSARNKADEQTILAMQGVFEYGMMHYELSQRPLGKDARDAAKGFAYFNQCLSADQQKSLMIADGRHPVSDLAFAKMGSLMAARLKEKFGAARLDSYHKTGIIPFFADYAAMASADPGYPKELRLNESFEKQLARWDQDWKRTWNDSIRRIAFSHDDDPSSVAAQMRKSFTGMEVFPDFSSKLRDATLRLAILGDKQNALIAGKLAVDLYPEFPGGYGSLGIAKAISGEKEGTLALLKRSLELNPNGLASAANLNRIAMQLVAVGKVEEAIAVLKAGEELHPQASVFTTSLKRISEKKAQRD
jgi:CubicO group peptidase (beta-lactamase class C family)/tetratricopeptide (TPR) repeat protein